MSNLTHAKILNSDALTSEHICQADLRVCTYFACFCDGFPKGTTIDQHSGWARSARHGHLQRVRPGCRAGGVEYTAKHIRSAHPTPGQNPLTMSMHGLAWMLVYLYYIGEAATRQLGLTLELKRTSQFTEFDSHDNLARFEKGVIAKQDELAGLVGWNATTAEDEAPLGEGNGQAMPLYIPLGGP
jgi:hypothetical protein